MQATLSLVPMIVLGGARVEHVKQVELLGMVITDDLQSQGHIDSMWELGILALVLEMLQRAGVNPKDIMTIYVAVVRSIMEYACQVWHTSMAVHQREQWSRCSRVH